MLSFVQLKVLMNTCGISDITDTEYSTLKNSFESLFPRIRKNKTDDNLTSIHEIVFLTEILSKIITEETPDDYKQKGTVYFKWEEKPDYVENTTGYQFSNTHCFTIICIVFFLYTRNYIKRFVDIGAGRGYLLYLVKSIVKCPVLGIEYSKELIENKHEGVSSKELIRKDFYKFFDYKSTDLVFAFNPSEFEFFKPYLHKINKKAHCIFLLSYINIDFDNLEQYSTHLCSLLTLHINYNRKVSKELSHISTIFGLEDIGK